VGSAEIEVSFDSAPGESMGDLHDHVAAEGSDGPPPSDEEAIPVSETEPVTVEAAPAAAQPPPPPPPPLTPISAPTRSRPPAPSVAASTAGADILAPPAQDDSTERASLRKPPPPPPPKRPRPSGPPPSDAAVAKALEAPRFEPPTKPRAKPWWEELFTDDFGRGILPLTETQVKREVTFIEESLGVAKGGVVLDLGCGAGHHATELSSRGYGVVGFDLSLPQLATAGEYAQERGQKINFLQGDMRDMSFDEVFDGIYCWNTSFGYFEEDKNFAVAERVFKALRPGGSFLLDVINRDFVVEHQPSQVWFEGDACVCMDDMSVDFITSRLRVKRTMMLDDGRTRECTFSIRVYSLHELGKLLHEIGFRVTEASGHIAYPGVFFGATSPRVVILAQKP
jgi:SAM-dependent methyltransferase